MLERGFANNTLSWLRPALGTVDKLAPIAAAPPNLRDEMCGPKRAHPASDEDNDVVANTSTTSAAVMSFLATGSQPPALRPVDMMAAAPAPSDPVIVYTGPTRTGVAITAAAEADAARDAPPKAGKRSKTAHGKRGGNAAPEAKTTEKSKSRVSVTINPKSTKPPVDTKPAASKKHSAKRGGTRPASGTDSSAKPKTAESKSKP
jgi:D-alanyl-D-alanine carboxypeptidase